MERGNSKHRSKEGSVFKVNNLIESPLPEKI